MTNRYIQLERMAGAFIDETWVAFGANVQTLDTSGEDIKGDHQWIYPESSANRIKRNRVTGPKKFGGSIDIPIYPVDAVALLYYSLGSSSTVIDTPVVGINTHTFKKATTIPFFRAAVGRDLREHQYVGNLVNGVDIDYDPADLLGASFDIVTRRERNDPVANTLANITFPDYNTANRAFGGVEVTPEINDVAVTYVESATISWENTVSDDIFALGNAYLPAAVIAGFVPSGSLDLRFDAIAPYSDWINGVEPKLELNASYGAGVAQRKVNITCPKISYDTEGLPTDNLERFILSLEFTPERDSADDAIIVDVVNARTAAQVTG